MAEQKPASEQMQTLASAVTNIGTMIQKDFIEIGRPDLADALLAGVKKFEPLGEALYARMQREEQERVALAGEITALHLQNHAMTAVLANLAARNVVQPANQSWAYDSCGCCQAILHYDDADAHEPDCPWIAARALLVKVDTGKGHEA